MVSTQTRTSKKALKSVSRTDPIAPKGRYAPVKDTIVLRTILEAFLKVLTEGDVRGLKRGAAEPLEKKDDTKRQKQNMSVKKTDYVSKFQTFSRDGLKWNGQLVTRETHLVNKAFSKFVLFSIVEDNASFLFGLKSDKDGQVSKKKLLFKPGLSSAKKEMRSLVDTMISEERRLNESARWSGSTDLDICRLWNFLVETAPLDMISVSEGGWFNRRFTAFEHVFGSQYRSMARGVLKEVNPQDYDNLRDFVTAYAWLKILGDQTGTLKDMFQLMDEFVGHGEMWTWLRSIKMPAPNWLNQWNMLASKDWTRAYLYRKVKASSSVVVSNNRDKQMKAKLLREGAVSTHERDLVVEKMLPECNSNDLCFCCAALRHMLYWCKGNHL